MKNDYPSIFAPRKRRNAYIPLVLLALIGAVFILNHHFQWFSWPWVEKAPVAEPPPPPRAMTSTQGLVIDFNKLRDRTDPTVGQVMDKRKQNFGLDQSVDLVVGPGESIKVGTETVPLSDILDEVEGSAGGPKSPAIPSAIPATEGLKEQSLDEKTPAAYLKTPPTPDGTESVVNKDLYGVYVVRKGDNLWDIHFFILREYLAHLGIEIPTTADERRLANGRSTGISRILKYAESMVYIFNLKTRKKDTNLDLLEPDAKVVVFNLSRLDKILGGLTPENIDRVHYDGRQLHIKDRP